ncbi:MAG: methyl-accepting chemotaxis protein [Agarilytica sp.]
MTLFQNMRITHKISALMVGLVLGFILIGVTYYIQVNLSENTRNIENQAFEYQRLLGQLESQSLQLQIATGGVSMAEGSEKIDQLYSGLSDTIAAIKALSLASTYMAEIKEITGLLNQHKTLSDSPIFTVSTQLSTQHSPELSPEQDSELGVETEVLTEVINPEIATVLTRIHTILNTLAAKSKTNLATISEEATEQAQITQAAVTGIIFIVAMMTAVGIYLLYKSIVFPLIHMQSVIRRINRGKTNARVKVLTQDELGDLGFAFNKLFDERINQLEQQSKENERLNNSIISLIRALGAIANKDLTVKVPVSSDITGTISDAVNLLTSETAQTLREVKDISHEVNDVSEHLQEQSQLVMQFADNERRHIIATSKALKVLSSAMNDVAQHSEEANASAAQAINNTRAARGTVNKTVSGIRAIRETISETEKRMKRLGDRSQEVSGVVNLINTIAERTHILALNASMHAASAGEAGKGFAVVADEVQRLAESARTSTEEISTMVNNMRVETADTATMMNTLISQVAEGSRMAEEAGQQMEATETTTEQLVETVKLIAEQAIQQADVANRVKDRSGIIRGFTDKTEKQLQEQRIFTDNLKQYADTLVKHVNVFSLPSDKQEATKDETKPAKATTLASVG